MENFCLACGHTIHNSDTVNCPHCGYKLLRCSECKKIFSKGDGIYNKSFLNGTILCVSCNEKIKKANECNYCQKGRTFSDQSIAKVEDFIDPSQVTYHIINKVTAKRTKINYCPFCGLKLTQN